MEFTLRIIVPLVSVSCLLLTSLGCSETELSSIPPAAELPPEDVEPVVVPTPPVEEDPIDEVLPEEPIAHAGPDRTWATGDTVLLDGTGSFDPQGLDPLDYQWTLLNWPAGSSVQVTGLDVATPTFLADVPGSYQFELTVGNTAGLWDSTPATVEITAEADPALEPIADAGVDQAVSPLDIVALDGRASTDPQGLTPLTYAWTLVSRPAGSGAIVLGQANAQPTFFADLAGSYVFDLSVMNSAGVWDSTPDQVSVEAVPQDGFYVEVSWDAGNDLDLHILDGASTLWSNGDVTWCNMTPGWGAPGTADDPSLDWDAIYGFGPETTTISTPAPGSYTVAVHYYGMDGDDYCGFGCPTTTATVKVYLSGVLTDTFTRDMSDAGEVWTVASIDWPAAQVNAIDTMGSTTGTSCQ